MQPVSVSRRDELSPLTYAPFPFPLLPSTLLAPLMTPVRAAGHHTREDVNYECRKQRKLHFSGPCACCRSHSDGDAGGGQTSTVHSRCHSYH
jgi:hypothetical protein